ncbi:MAG: hypothetical protein AB1830_10190 [Pseudomonadota bacterium]
MSKYVRRAAGSFRPSGDERVLEGLIEHTIQTTRRKNRAVDEALVFVEASNRRISSLEAQRRLPSPGE